MKQFIFVTGASGVGKTTLVNTLKECTEGMVFVNFDDIGVPSYETMVEQYGSGEEWQRQMIFAWLENLTDQYVGDEVILMEGSVRFEFLAEGFENYQIKHPIVVPLDADEETITARLHQRGHSELVNQDMFNWLAYLRSSAKANNVISIDTSAMSTQQVVEKFLSIRT